jgi:hypothetical protein
MALRAILDKAENDIIAQLPASALAAFAQRSWGVPGHCQETAVAPVGVLGSIRVKSITRSGWLVLNRAGVAPAAVAGTKGSPTGANGGPFYLPVAQWSRSRFACALVINRLSVAPACGMLRHPGVIITQIMEGSAKFCLLLKSKKAKRMISNLFALSV